jgi:hypothetical protein
MTIRFLSLFAGAAVAVLSMAARAQSTADPGNASSPTVSSSPAPSWPTYMRPTEAAKIRNYSFDAFGPYPIAVSLVDAGIEQEDNSPPEWKQGVAGYSKRFGSEFAAEAVSTTTRYVLSDAFREDAQYYRCECTGFVRRFSYAAVSTLTARRGRDGHRVFSLPGLIAPYAGSMTAVYAWYPGRYNAKDAFRMGNYTLLGYVGANLGLEFFPREWHSLHFRAHLNNGRGDPEPAPR